MSATRLSNPDFAELARAYGATAETIDRTEDFAAALNHAKAGSGVRLLHIRTDIEVINFATTIAALRAR